MKGKRKCWCLTRPMLVQELKGNIRVFCRVRPLVVHDALTQSAAVDQLLQFPSSGPATHSARLKRKIKVYVCMFKSDYNGSLLGGSLEHPLFLPMQSCMHVSQSMSHAEHTVSYSFNDVSRSPECGWHERSRPAWCMLPTALSAVSAQQLQSIGVCDCGLQAISNAVAGGVSQHGLHVCYLSGAGHSSWIFRTAFDVC